MGNEELAKRYRQLLGAFLADPAGRHEAEASALARDLATAGLSPVLVEDLRNEAVAHLARKWPAEAVADAAKRVSQELFLSYSRHFRAGRVADDQAHQLELKDRFLSHVSHELRSPLTVIYQFNTILLDEIAGPLTDDQREYLQTMLRNVNYLKGMIGDLLDATRSQAGKLSVRPERCDLGELIQERIASAQQPARERELDLRAELPANVPDIFADPVRIRQVLANLLGNALKYTPVGGAITVSVHSSPQPDCIEIAVRDTGCGIPPGELDQVFENLFQGRQADAVSRLGLGLGLFISRQLVTLHGGTIEVESEVGVGSVFRFTLPACTKENTGDDLVSSRQEVLA